MTDRVCLGDQAAYDRPEPAEDQNLDADCDVLGRMEVRNMARDNSGSQDLHLAATQAKSTCPDSAQAKHTYTMIWQSVSRTDFGERCLAQRSGCGTSLAYVALAILLTVSQGVARLLCIWQHGCLPAAIVQHERWLSNTI